MQTSMDGIKVLDCSMGVAGPHAGLLCAQNGAQVVKVETADGDWSRLLGKPYGDLSAFSAVLNRGKRSLSVNLKSPEVLQLVADMAATSDVVIEAFRPHVMKKFGLDYESVRARNPDVIYLSVSGFGQTGSRSMIPTNDSVAQAYSGFMHVNRDEDGRPQRLDMIVMDVVTGLYGFQAISTALIAKFRGRPAGRHIDCSLMQCATSFQAVKLAEYYLEGGAQAMYMPLGVFETKDGFISISTLHDHQYLALCEALGRPDLGVDPRYLTRAKRVEHKKQLLPALREVLTTRTTAQWQEALGKHEVIHAPVRDYSDVLQDEQLKLLNAISWLDQDGIAGQIPVANIPGLPPFSTARSAQAPHVGEHTVEILLERGLSRAEVDQWLSAGLAKSFRPAIAAA